VKSNAHGRLANADGDEDAKSVAALRHASMCPVLVQFMPRRSTPVLLMYLEQGKQAVQVAANARVGASSAVLKRAYHTLP
jgi:hypothetical protein